MALTIAGIEAMGFKPMAPGDKIEAEFYSLHVYEVQGFLVPEGSVVTRDFKVASVPYRIGTSGSVNALARALTGANYTEDEPGWERIHKCKPPYIILYIGPTKLHSCSQSFVKTEGAQIHTYNAFSEARAELRRAHDQILPSIETALSCSATSPGRTTKFRLVDRVAFGLTPEKCTVIDIRVDMNVRGYAAFHVDENWVTKLLDNAGALADSISPKVSRPFRLGLVNQDPLKRFIYFFLALEIETHRVYSSIDHERQLEQMLDLPERVRGPALKLLTSHPGSLRNLFDRFVWCALCVWDHIGDLDINEFRHLKEVRDKIAHGSIEFPPTDAVHAVEKLTTKLISRRCIRNGA